MRMLMTTALVALISGPSLAENWRDDYQVVKFGILSGENERDRIARYTPFEQYLEQELGVEVEIFTAGNYDGVIQALAADQIEFAFMGSSAYAAAYTATDGGVMPLVSRVQNDGSTGYFSILVTRCDSVILPIWHHLRERYWLLLTLIQRRVTPYPSITCHKRSPLTCTFPQPHFLVRTNLVCRV